MAMFTHLERLWVQSINGVITLRLEALTRTTSLTKPSLERWPHKNQSTTENSKKWKSKLINWSLKRASLLKCLRHSVRILNSLFSSRRLKVLRSSESLKSLRERKLTSYQLSKKSLSFTSKNCLAISSWFLKKAMSSLKPNTTKA